ncbi:MAG: hypothetical protein Q4G42_06230 [Neisseria sp.]|nr:hypothetical protein [Neisseria sp.]
MNKIKLWLTLGLHVLAFMLVLMLQVRLQHPALAWTQEAYWQAVGAAFDASFATSAALLLAVFLLLAPLWAVFITRNAPLYGNLVWAVALAWCGLIVLLFFGIVKIQPWLYWFLYAALMLFLGMAGILYRVFRNQEQVETHFQGD